MKSIKIVFDDDTDPKDFTRLVRIIEGIVKLLSDVVTAAIFVEDDDATDQRETN